MGRNVPSHPGPIPASHRTGMRPNFFSWDGMGPNLCGMGAPGPVPALCQDRDGTRSWWDGSSHPGPMASLVIHIMFFSDILAHECDIADIDHAVQFDVVRNKSINMILQHFDQAAHNK